jgi:toxin FitB
MSMFLFRTGYGSFIQPILDSMIAATAIEHGPTIVTRNTEDFAPANVSVLNIWK